MTAPACKHELPPDQCAFCSGRDPVSPEAARKGPWFTAGYSGECDGCGDRIEEGDRIRADGMGGWVCEECGEGH